MNDDLFYTSKIDAAEFKVSVVIDDPADRTIADLSATLDSIVEALQRIETGVAEFNLKCHL